MKVSLSLIGVCVSFQAHTRNGSAPNKNKSRVTYGAFGGGGV